jgi:hypothetical protein
MGKKLYMAAHLPPPQFNAIESAAFVAEAGHQTLGRAKHTSKKAATKELSSA